MGDEEKKDSLGDRMKRLYEKPWQLRLPGRMPILLRVDGRAFHSLTRNCERPFDPRLMSAMDQTAIALCQDISGAQMAYVQSDEITVLIHPYKRYQTQCWFDGEVQKMVSVGAAIATSAFNAASISFGQDDRLSDRSFVTHRATLSDPWWPGHFPVAQFDARVFVLPEVEVCNAYLWRQQDASRNSLQMLARSIYSHKECEGKVASELHEMCFRAGKNWNDLPTAQRRGRCVVPLIATGPKGPERRGWVVDDQIPIFSENRAYIEMWLATEPEAAVAAGAAGVAP